jgi:hypothetical protein
MPCESDVPPLRAAALASAVERELWTMVSTTHSGTFHRHSCINAAQRRHAREFDTRMPAVGRAAFRRITIRVPDTASRLGSGANASWLGPHQSVTSLTQPPRSSSRCSAGAGMLPQQQTHRTT